MQMTFKAAVAVMLISSSWCSVSYCYQLPEDLIIIPEKTNYQQTSTHEDMMNFVNAIKAKSDLIHVETMAVSFENRELPLVVLADPKVTTPEDARRSGKPVIYLQGNIHGGEVEGKETLLLILRDILLGDKRFLLSDQILLIAPIYNPDGNDKMSEDSRRSQEGSPKLAGSRRNGQGYDLNRDGVKMEALETAGLIKNVVLKWDPELFVDLHTTNGSWHGYSMTYAPSYHSAGHPATSDYTMNTMLPEITKIVDQKYDLKMYLYGWYSLRNGWPPKIWRTYNHHPRYLVNQFGFRNKMAILSETFAHDRFYKRIQSAYAFASEIIEYTNQHGREMARINRAAEEETVQYVLENAGKVKKGVRFRMVPLDEKFTLRTYEYKPYVNARGQTKFVRSGRIVEIPDVENHSRFEAEVESTLPRGYLFPAELGEITEMLARHGAEVVRLDKAVAVGGEEFIVEKFDRSEREFEGHQLVRLSGTYSAATRQFPAGSFKIDLAQPLANLIFYLLEPESDDGLATWNFFDDYLIERNVESEKVAFPVFKYFEMEDK